MYVLNRKRELDNVNYKFERMLKAKPIRTELVLTLSRDPEDVRLLFYSTNDRPSNQRYFSIDKYDSFSAVPKERIFRKVESKSFLSEDGMLASKDPCDSRKDLYFTFCDDVGGASSFDSDLPPDDRKFSKFQGLTFKQKRNKIQEAINFDEANIDQWLKFLKLEDEEFEVISKMDKSSASKTRPSFLERRLEIVKRGLEKVMQKNSLKLHLEYIYTATELYGYHDNRVKDRWQKLLNLHVNSLDLWRDYIKQFLHNSSEFNMKMMLNNYDAAIEKLSAIYTGVFVSHKMQNGTEDFLIELVVNRSRLLIEAGYLHIVVAILQSVAEVYFFAPEEVKSKSWPNRLKAFEEFWSVGLPLLGEIGSKGWKNLSIDERDNFVCEKLTSEDSLNHNVDESVGELVKECAVSEGTNKLLVWAQLEKIRSSHFWIPTGRLKELKPHASEFEKRFVDFDNVKSSILPFDDQKLCMKLVMSLLQLLGATVAGMDDTSQFGFLNAVLPNGFDFLKQEHRGLNDFLLKFMHLLCSSDCIGQVEQVMATIVSTRLVLMEHKNATFAEKCKALNEIESTFQGLNASGVARFCGLSCIYEAIINSSAMQQNFTGRGLSNIFENLKKTSVEKAVLNRMLQILQAGNPCMILDDRQKQISLHLGYLFAKLLPSHHVSLTLNRLHFLTLLMTGHLDKFLNKSFKVEAELIEEAREILADTLNRAVSNRLANANSYSFIDSSHTTIFKLYSFFEFEYSQTNPFLDLTGPVREFINRSAARTKFQLDFMHELTIGGELDRKIYSSAVHEAIERHAKVPALYFHLVNIYKAKGCRFLNFRDWNKLDLEVKTGAAFALFAAEYSLFNKACDADDNLLSAGIYRRIKHIFEESSKLIADSFAPDSFIWRLWHEIELAKRRKASDLDDIFVLGMQSCPFSKQLMLDTAYNSFKFEAKLREIENLFEKYCLNVFSAPGESELILLAAMKLK